jgi:glycerol-3-phosphate dehydrogenase
MPTEPRMPLLIFVNKGIESDTQALTLEIIADTCGPEVAKVAAFLVSISCCSVSFAMKELIQSGPSFAKESKSYSVRVLLQHYNDRPEVVRRQPTAVSVVSLSREHAERASNIFHQPHFRW